MKANIYSEYIDVDPDVDAAMKKVFMNHLVIYNISLAILYKHPEISFKDLKKQALHYVVSRNIAPVFELALCNELYYQYKKFKSNIRVQKLVTDIQYFTFLLKDHSCKSLILKEDHKTLYFPEIDMSVTLSKELPEFKEDSLTYLNLSYSNQENRYKLSLHAAH